MSLLALIAAWPLNVPALGLGEAIVKSHLGAPLEVQIPLILDGGEHADGVTVRFASAADRARLGNRSENFAMRMRIAVVTRGRHGPSISVTSAASVREPTLTFVIEAKADSTRIMREYTVLLDPIDYRGALEAAPARSLQTRRAPHSNAAPRASAALSRTSNGNLYGPVAPGETLSELGAKLRADGGVSVSQMSMALFLANPRAFTGNDVNRLIAGAYLRVPDRDESTAVSERVARERLYGPAPVTPARGPSRAAAATPGVPAVSPAPQSPMHEPSTATGADTAATAAATPGRSTGDSSDPTPPEQQFRLSILAADPQSNDSMADVISRSANSNDIAVRNLVARLDNARQAGEDLVRRNLALRERISVADARISKLAGTLRERNERIRAIQVAIESERTSRPSLTAVTATRGDDDPYRQEDPEGRSITGWQWLAGLARKVSPLAWLGAVVALGGTVLLLRRSRRQRDSRLRDDPFH